MWIRRNVWIMILVQYLVAFAAFSHCIGVQTIYKMGDDGQFTFVGIDPGVAWRNRFIYLGGSLLYSIMSVCFNGRLYTEWRKFARLGQSNRISHHEKGLLFYTALVFVSTMLLCLQQIARIVATLAGDPDFDKWATMQYFWINDLMVWVPPFCLMVLSSDLRRDIMNFLLCRRQRAASTTVAVSAFNQRHSIVKISGQLPR